MGMLVFPEVPHGPNPGPLAGAVPKSHFQVQSADTPFQGIGNSFSEVWIEGSHIHRSLPQIQNPCIACREFLNR